MFINVYIFFKITAPTINAKLHAHKPVLCETFSPNFYWKFIKSSLERLQCIFRRVETDTSDLVLHSQEQKKITRRQIRGIRLVENQANGMLLQEILSSGRGVGAGVVVMPQQSSGSGLQTSPAPVFQHLGNANRAIPQSRHGQQHRRKGPLFFVRCSDCKCTFVVHFLRGRPIGWTGALS